MPHAPGIRGPRCNGEGEVSPNRRRKLKIPAPPSPSVATIEDLPVGRPTKLTPELQEKICNFLRGGAYLETAVKASGITKQTLYEWMARANEVRAVGHSDAYTQFADSVQEAMAQGEMRDLAVIDKAAVGDPKEKIAPDWRAAAFRLERKYPKRWGRKQAVLVTPGPAGGKEHEDADNLHAGVLGLIEGIRTKRYANGKDITGSDEESGEDP